MEMVQPGQFLSDLHTVLQRLAAPAAEQVAYLRQIGVAPLADELALDLVDVLVLLPQFRAEVQLTDQQVESVRAVDEILERMSGKEDLWTEAALHNHPDWAEISLPYRKYERIMRPV